MEEYTTLEQVKIRLKQFHIETVENEDEGTSSDVTVFDQKEDNPYIEQLIKQARQDVAMARNYPAKYSKEQIAEDLKNYEGIIVNLAVYDHSQAGEAYMASYSENGVSRIWKNREDLLAGVFPLVKAL